MRHDQLSAAAIFNFLTSALENFRLGYGIGNAPGVDYPQ
jgi:hypothetical protein